jgi:hypothetical protein
MTPTPPNVALALIQQKRPGKHRGVGSILRPEQQRQNSGAQPAVPIR